jgi:RNA polymerase primary sigma factor
VLIKKERSAEIRSSLEKYVPMAKSIAKKYVNSNLSYDDLVQEGLLGLLEAEDKYNFQKGTKYSTFAYTVMKNRILTYCTKEQKARRNLYPLDEKRKNEPRRKAESINLFYMPNEMPEMERKVLRHIYKEGKTLKEASGLLGIRRERAAQLKKLALRRLKINKKLTKSLYGINSN